jgi:hypothetical protein
VTGVGSGTIRDRSGRRYKQSTVRGYAADLRQHVVIVALMMALDRLENQPEPARLLGWL